MILKFSRNTLISLRFWWKPKVLRTFGEWQHDQSNQATTKPLSASTWAALADAGILKNTRGKRAGKHWKFFIGNINAIYRPPRYTRSEKGTVNLNNLISIHVTDFCNHLDIQARDSTFPRGFSTHGCSIDNVVLNDVQQHNIPVRITARIEGSALELRPRILINIKPQTATYPSHSSKFAWWNCR